MIRAKADSKGVNLANEAESERDEDIKDMLKVDDRDSVPGLRDSIPGSKDSIPTWIIA